MSAMSGGDVLDARESMDFDVVIVGAGPAGLAAAIRLKQLAADLSVVVVEKGSEVGAHILSGVVMDPEALDALLPDWREDAARPLTTPVADDHFYYLTARGGTRLPNALMPRLMSNHGNFIGSLGSVARYLGTRAEALGVDVYPGFAASELLYDDAGAVVGIATGDMGLGKDGKPTGNFTRGMELRGRYTLLAEGGRRKARRGRRRPWRGCRSIPTPFAGPNCRNLPRRLGATAMSARILGFGLSTADWTDSSSHGSEGRRGWRADCDVSMAMSSALMLKRS